MYALTLYAHLEDLRRRAVRPIRRSATRSVFLQHLLPKPKPAVGLRARAARRSVFREHLSGLAVESRVARAAPRVVCFERLRARAVVLRARAAPHVVPHLSGQAAILARAATRFVFLQSWKRCRRAVGLRARAATGIIRIQHLGG